MPGESDTHATSMADSDPTGGLALKSSNCQRAQRKATNAFLHYLNRRNGDPLFQYPTANTEYPISKGKSSVAADAAPTLDIGSSMFDIGYSSFISFHRTFDRTFGSKRVAPRLRDAATPEPVERDGFRSRHLRLKSVTIL